MNLDREIVQKMLQIDGRLIGELPQGLAKGPAVVRRHGVGQGREEVAAEAGVEAQAGLARHAALDDDRFDAVAGEVLAGGRGLVGVGVAVTEVCQPMPLGQAQRQIERADALA